MPWGPNSFDIGGIFNFYGALTLSTHHGFFKGASTLPTLLRYQFLWVLTLSTLAEYSISTGPLTFSTLMESAAGPHLFPTILIYSSFNGALTLPTLAK